MQNLNLYDAFNECIKKFGNATLVYEPWQMKIRKNKQINVKQLSYATHGFNVNYLHSRKQSYDILPADIKLSSLSKKQALKTATRQTMSATLCSFGRYKLLMRLRERSKAYDIMSTNYVHSAAALEQYHKLLDDDNYNIYNLQSNIAVPLVAGIGVDISKTAVFDGILFQQFVCLYMRVTFLSTFRNQGRHIHTCSNHRRGVSCLGCVEKDAMRGCYLGYIMLFCAECIMNVLHST